MSKLLKYIKEKDELDNIIKTIKNDCGPFLKEFHNMLRKGEYLYRGKDEIIDGMKKVIPRKNRRPLDTPIKLHDMLDSLFEMKFGWKARSEGVFVTTNHGTAMSYGEGSSYAFFPIGKYSYIWSPSIKDLYMKLRFKKIIDVFGEINYTKFTEEEIFEHLENIIDKDYFDKGLRKKTVSGPGTEAMFRCKAYYLVDDDYYKYEDFYKNLTKS